MAHRSIIQCDACGAEDTTAQGPYPDGWILVCVTEYVHNTQIGKSSKKSDSDLCVKCATAWKAFWQALNSRKIAAQ